MRRRLLMLAVVYGAAASPADAQLMRLAKPITELEAAAVKDSADPTAHYALGLGYWYAKRYDDAERELLRAVTIEPRLAAAQLSLAYLPFARRPKLWKEVDAGKVSSEWRATVDSARSRYHLAFLADPFVDFQVLGLFASGPLPMNFTGDGASIIRGFEYLYAMQYPSAFHEFDLVYAKLSEKQRTSDWWLTWMHGNTAARANMWQVALADFDRLLEQAEKLENESATTQFGLLLANELRYMKASVLARAGRSQDAIGVYQFVLERDIAMHMAHVQLANLFESQGRYRDALIERERALESSPDDASLLFDYGVTLARAGKLAAADTVLGRALDRNPHSARIPYMAGLVQRQLGDTARSTVTLRRFLAIAPSSYGRQVAEVREYLPAPGAATSQ